MKAWRRSVSVSFATVLGAAAFACACGGTSFGDREPITAPSAPALELPPNASVPESHATTLASRPELHAEISAPSTAPWLSSAAGIGTRRVRVVVKNVGAQPSKVADWRISFRATRDGVAFACNPHDGANAKEPEPTELAPGQSFTYERDLDCSFPVLGRYDVAVFARVGQGDAAKDDPVGSFSIEVTGQPPWAPRAYAPVPGLQLALTGENETRALPEGAWKHGDHAVTLLVVNSGASPLKVAAAKATLAVATKVVGVGTGLKVGALACPHDAMQTSVPGFSLAPGEQRTVPLPLKCALAPKGEYEITLFYATADDKGDGPEEGRLHVRVRGEDEPPLPISQPLTH